MNDIESVKSAANDMVANAERMEYPGALLLGGAAINLAIIADAVSKLQLSNSDPNAMSLRDLSAEERRVVDALRNGDLRVRSARSPGTDQHGFVVDGFAIP